MNSLPSINPMTVAKIKKALDSYGEDAEFLVKFVESVMNVTHGSGYGKITVYVQDKKVNMIRAEQTHAFEKDETTTKIN